jgi:archaellum component FlaC
MPKTCSNCKVNKQKKNHKKDDKFKTTSRKRAIRTTLENGRDLYDTIQSNERVMQLLRENLVLVSTDRENAEKLFTEAQEDLNKLDSNRREVLRNVENFARKPEDAANVVAESLKRYNDNNNIRNNLVRINSDLLSKADASLAAVARQHVDQINKYIAVNRNLENLLVDLPNTLSLILATK